MNLFHLGRQYNLKSQDISNAFLIAVRTMLGTESLDFEFDNRGDIPDELHLEIEAIRSHGRVWKYKGTAKVDGKRMADAEWSATIVDKK